VSGKTAFIPALSKMTNTLWSVAHYIERNPLKIGLAEKAADCRWSSAKAHLTGATDELLSQPDWLDVSARGDYANFFRIEDEEQNNAIRKATRSGRLYGSESFIDSLEYELNFRLRSRKVGRPRKQGEGN
jgi:putative transposase